MTEYLPADRLSSWKGLKVVDPNSAEAETVQYEHLGVTPRLPL